MMTRVSLALPLALILAGCSSTSSQTEPDGGTRNPDGGAPVEGAPCEVDGYPCSPSEQTEEAIELSEEYKSAIEGRRADGESYTDIGEWLREQEGVVDVVAADDRLRFRVEGGSANWFYSISREYPEMPTPPFSEEANPPAIDPVLGPKSVIREDDSEDDIKKKALIVEPFAFQFPSPATTWKQRLEELHDYGPGSVEHQLNDQIDDAFFRNWNDYQFVWVLSHGAYLPDPANPTYTAIFSAKQCGINKWIAQEIVAGRGNEMTSGNKTIAELLGTPRNAAEQLLTGAQFVRWINFRNGEQQSLGQAGKGCGVVDIGSVTTPGGNIVQPAFLDFIYYDEAWFNTHYSSGLDNVFLQLSVCSSLAVPIRGGGQGPTAILGWTEPVGASQDDSAVNVLFDRLINRGETIDDAFSRLQESGNDSHRFEGKTTELKLQTYGGGRRARVRETVTIIDLETLEKFPDRGGMIEAREITDDGSTIVDVTVDIVGHGRLDGDAFNLSFVDGQDQPLSLDWEVDDPRDGVSRMTVPVFINQRITTPTEVDIEARVSLPEDNGTKFARHPITLTVDSAVESLWRLDVGGAGTARGEFVFAPLPVGTFDDEGRLVWQVTLSQDDGSVVPLAIIIIVGHAGRTPECTGQTGNFDAIVSITYTEDPMPNVAYGGGLGAGECGDFVNVNILSFSKEEDLVAEVSGTICQARRIGDETVVTPVPIQGRFQMPSAGCGADPGGDLVGSYYTPQEPSLCFDIYPNAAIAPAFQETCAMGGGQLVCSEDPCQTTGQVGQCDYRDDSVNITFRGQVQHFGSGGDWPSPAELQLACELQLGVWTTGDPNAMQQ